MKRAFRACAPLLFAASALALLHACNSSPSTPTNPTGGGSTPVMNATVRATGNTFSPAVVNLLPGGTVTFTNDGGRHNVNASGSQTFRCAVGCDAQGGNGNPSTDGWSFTVTFPAAGTTNFVCDEHVAVGMTGQIIVQ